ncbi:MAG: NAD(+) diphosphatase [Ilumatobacter sp.]|uniref:NAD(+) diphosphatase n=1 Tax=Ilumatobacter sp. TaxID=1967498 RepID=UPI0032985A8C
MTTSDPVSEPLATTVVNTVSMNTATMFDALNALPDGFDGLRRYVHVIATKVFVDDRPEDPAWPAHFIGLLDGEGWWAVDVPEGDDPSYGAAIDLYGYFSVASQSEWLLAGRAVQTVEWARTHQFCGRCAMPTEPSPGERGLKCPACDLISYPRVAPAMITLVTRGAPGPDQEALLARGVRFPMPMYSCLAGFVEPGEDLEGAVIREVKEEVGVDVDDVCYVGSQPWPFPHSLMVGFRAAYVGGDIVCEEAEIMDAQWYRKDAMPMIPPEISIAGKIIRAWLDEDS